MRMLASVPFSYDFKAPVPAGAFSLAISLVTKNEGFKGDTTRWIVVAIGFHILYVLV